MLGQFYATLGLIWDLKLEPLTLKARIIPLDIQVPNIYIYIIETG